jgi:hypothetical protein
MFMWYNAYINMIIWRETIDVNEIDTEFCWNFLYVQGEL